MLSWSPLIVDHVPVLFNKCSAPSCFPSVRIVLPAVPCRSGSSLWNVHLHHLSLTGRHAMCCLIDVWICLRRRDCLSHGSVRQNMCEQKWGHLGKIKKKKLWRRGGKEERWNYMSMFQTNPDPPVCAVCVYLTEREWAACVCLCVCIPECIPVCIAVCVWRRDFEIFSFVPHLMFPIQAKRVAENDRCTGVVWQASSAGRTWHTGTGGVYLHPEVRMRSSGTQCTHLLSTESLCVLDFDVLQSLSVLFGHI